MSDKFARDAVEIEAGKPLESKWSKPNPLSQSKFSISTKLSHLDIGTHKSSSHGTSESQAIEINPNTTTEGTKSGKVQPIMRGLDSKWANSTSATENIRSAKKSHLEHKQMPQLSSKSKSSSTFPQPSSTPQFHKFPTGPKKLTMQRGEQTNDTMTTTTSPRVSSSHMNGLVDDTHYRKHTHKHPINKHHEIKGRNAKNSQAESLSFSADQSRGSADTKKAVSRYERRKKDHKNHQIKADSKHDHENDYINDIKRNSSELSLSAWEGTYDPNESWADAEADYYK